MIGEKIKHYKIILDKLGEVRLRQGFVAQGGPNYVMTPMGRLVLRSFKIIDFEL